MAKCKYTVKHWFIFEKASLTENDFNEVIENFDSPAVSIRRKGSYKTRIPTEFVQSNQVHGALGYDLEFDYDKMLAGVTADYRVRIVSDGNRILHLRGPAADPDGAQRKLKFVAVEETD